ncbi:tannase/feruloyl esterase family alpha/beta hydrolase [Caulobacter sp. KR2-114]|uniref:tannase/feruloyl esterase family alpha/beta hydrolase n=1 Tax=Caulobacter sp. KR2-114 TaxID=3400912 RepID=UPI003C0514F5
MRGFGWLGAGVLALAGLLLSPQAASARELKCADLRDIALDHAGVTKVTTEALSDTVNACRLQVTAKPTPGSDIRIEVWIPVGGAWNGKFVQFGNGGFAGRIPTAYIKAAAAQGYATAATDDGHQTDQGTDGRWALRHPEKVADFGWRALKVTTDVGKALILAQKGVGPGKSYFDGCSDGGREALMTAQRQPEDFDGIVAGAPAYDFTHLLGYAAFEAQALKAAPDAYLGPPQLAILQAAALKACAGGGSYIVDPMACRFDPGQAQCRPGQNGGDCLTAAQVGAARAIYGGLHDPRSGKLLMPGLTFGGEAQPGGWEAWVTGPSGDRLDQARSNQFGSNFFKYMAFGDPAYDMLKLDLGAGLDEARGRTSHDLDAVDPDLGRFKAHGGKLIQFHGWNDAAIPARLSIAYYEDVRRTMGPTDGFYRLYMVPGMLHCGGGAGPGNVDWLAQLDRWVTVGEAPGPLQAGAGSPAAPGPADAPGQLLCPYPQVATKAPSGWRCGGAASAAPPARRGRRGRHA